MTTVVIDASVWVAAVDRDDVAHDASHDCLLRLTRGDVVVVVPMHARVELACALARRFDNADNARELANALLAASFLREATIDSSLAHEALLLGTALHLRAADAIYAAVAVREDAALITLDRELHERAGGVTPAEWLLPSR